VHPEDEQLLARWEADDRAEEIWKTLQAHAIGPFPLPDNKWSEPLDLFTSSVLLARKMASKVDEVYYRWKKKRARYGQLAINAEKLAEVYNKALIGASSSPSRADQNMRLRAKMLAEDAQIMRRLAARRPKLLMPISRMNRNGSRKRVAFMYLMSRSIMHLCGKPLDGIVASLTDIAFPSPVATSLEQVRSARRESTRAARLTPKKDFGRKKRLLHKR
jgi:hypothetical protein